MMWILFKIIVFIAAFFFRLAGKYFSRFGVLHHEFNGSPYFIKLSESKKTIDSTSFGIDFKCTSIFKITKEGYFDRLVKGVMVVNEVQTGDPDFDQSYYIASDDPTFRQMIKSDHDLRYAINQLFKNNCQYIFCDGSTLWVTFHGDQQENFLLVEKCFFLKEKVSTLSKVRAHMRRDPFSFRVLIIEAIIFSIAAYSWLGYGEFYIFREDVHLSPFLIMGFGLFVGALATLLLVGIIFVSLRGSSRSHRIIIESAIVLGLSIPMGGIQLVSDLNTTLDKSKPVKIEARIIRLYEQQHRGRRGRVYYTYHLDIDLINDTTEFYIPRHIEIKDSKFNELSGAQAVTLTIGKGYLKYPWYKEIKSSSSF